jgi:uncharacterized linocin/CFP29 family protein
VSEAISPPRSLVDPYRAVPNADAYTTVSETSDHGYPCWSTSAALWMMSFVWAPAIEGAFILSTRGGDFALHLGQDMPIGYANHT